MPQERRNARNFGTVPKWISISSRRPSGAHRPDPSSSSTALNLQAESTLNTRSCCSGRSTALSSTRGWPHALIAYPNLGSATGRPSAVDRCQHVIDVPLRNAGALGEAPLIDLDLVMLDRQPA